MNVYIAKVNI